MVGWLILLILLILLAFVILALRATKPTITAGAEISRLIGDARLPYKDVSKKYLPTLHDGQRKLLLSEIEFMTKYGDLSPTVLYVGAAMGRHLVQLSKMFPKHKFILYDPNKFYPKLYDNPAFEIHQEFFTDAHVKQYENKKLLFISDIRSEENADSPDEFEKDVLRNMEMQMDWVNRLKPVASSLKFRFPFKPGKTEYLDGDLYLQLFAPQTSAEARLFVALEKANAKAKANAKTKAKANLKTKMYDHTEHEERMWYHNNVDRLCHYEHGVNYPGLDNCYDCAAQVQILENYINTTKAKTTVIKLLEEMEAVCKPLNRDYHGLKISAGKCKKLKDLRRVLL